MENEKLTVEQTIIQNLALDKANLEITVMRLQYRLAELEGNTPDNGQ